MNRFARLAACCTLLLAIFGAAASAASAHTYDRDVTVWFGNKTIDSDDVVNGDLTVVFGNATCDSGAVIRGNVRVYDGHFYQYDGCELGGVADELGATDLGAVLLPWTGGSFADPAIVEQNRHVLRHIAYDVVILFAFLLFPLRVRVALERVEQHPGLSAAAGTLAAVAVIPLAILLLISVIGIPLIVVEVAAVMAGLWIGQAAVAIIVGRRLFELLRPHTTPSPLGALLLGLVVVTAGELLPGFGWIVTAIVSLVGLGAAILAFVRESSFATFTGRPAAAAATPPNTGGPPPPIGGVPMRPA
jgi:hypothetical protein